MNRREGLTGSNSQSDFAFPISLHFLCHANKTTIPFISSLTLFRLTKSASQRVGSGRRQNKDVHVAASHETGGRVVLYAQTLSSTAVRLAIRYF